MYKSGKTTQILLRFIILFSTKATKIVAALLGQRKYEALSNCILKTYATRFLYNLLAGAMITRFVKKDSLWSIKLLEGVRFVAPDSYSSPAHIISIWRRGTYGKYKAGKGQVVIDAGAHIGIYAVKASREVGRDGAVVAIEPHPYNFKCLKKNLELNNCQNVIPVNAALASSCGETSLFLHPKSTGHSIALKTSDDYIRVRTITLDQLVKDLSLTNIHLIKINVEGATHGLLKGAEKTLRLQKPKIMADIAHYPGEKDEAISFLSKRGFVVSTGNHFLYAEPECTP